MSSPTPPLFPAPTPPSPSDDAVSILLVDDNPKNLTALESILDSPEHRLTRARTAQEALMALMNESFAAIVLDVKMPDMSGIELARIIKQRKKTQHIPIIFLTAHFRENEDVVQGYDVGAVDYLTKPVHPAVLRSKVGVFVDLFRKTRALAEMNRTMESEIIERKTAEERFRVVVEAAPSAMLVFTGDGVLDLVNSEAERLFGLSREALLSRRINDLLEKAVLPYAATPFSTAPREIVVSGRDGTEIPAEVSFTPIQFGAGSRWLASIFDITERKRSEESLRTANLELEAKNQALEKQAEERNLRIRAESAQAEAEAANAAKDRFLAMLSHELRTPLSPVLHAVTLLDEECPESPSAVREFLQTIRRNVLLEARLIDDLLDLARIRNGKLQLDLQPADAHQLVHHALEICRPEITAHQLTVQTDLRASRSGLWADPARIQQIIWNLINNSIKHAPPGGVITIATDNEAADGTLRIKVIDTGAGIEVDKLTRIFDAFEQGTQDGASGLGLGLAISKALAEFHGGTIAAFSDGPGKGATFIVTLPTADVEAAAPVPPHHETSPRSHPLRLLVVDDHVDTVTTLRLLLVRRGYDVQSAKSVESALEVASGFNFDVLVTDIGLPDGSGVKLFETLKQRPGSAAIQGVAVSGFGMDEDIAQSKRAGFAEHLTKPIDFNRLQRCLSTIAANMNGNGR